MLRRAARGLAIALSCAGLLGAVLAVPAPARAALPTVREFVASVDSARGLVSSAKGSLDATAAATLAAELRSTLPRPARVTEGTRTIDMDLSDVDAAIERLALATTTDQRSSAVAELDTRLTALRSALGSEAPTAAPDPVDPAAMRELVAALPRSSNTGEDWLNTQLQKILDWITGWLAGLDPGGSAPAPRASRTIMVIVLALPVLLALIVIVRALRTLRRRKRSAPAGDLPEANGAPAVAAAADLPGDALGYAESLAATGAHREAVRALYGGAARHLVEAGAVSRMRTRTNLEMLRDVRAAAPELARPFESLTREFERDWYGHADPGEAGFERARSEYGRIVDAAPDEVPIADTAPPAAPGAGTAAPEGGERR